MAVAELAGVAVFGAWAVAGGCGWGGCGLGGWWLVGESADLGDDVAWFAWPVGDDGVDDVGGCPSVGDQLHDVVLEVVWVGS